MQSQQNNNSKIKSVKQEKSQKTIVGTALGNSKDKTVKVKIERYKIHPLYERKYSVSKNYLVHTEVEIVKGQKVKIQESTPISKNKSWKVVEAL